MSEAELPDTEVVVGVADTVVVVGATKAPVAVGAPEGIADEVAVALALALPTVFPILKGKGFTGSGFPDSAGPC